MLDRYQVQAELVDSKIFTTPILVVGAGGIGSFVVLTLAKMGFGDISVWDDDTIEEHNIASQFYPEIAVGAGKVASLDVVVKAFTGVQIKGYPFNWDNEVAPYGMGGVVVSAVDNMATRTELFRASIKAKSVGFVDGRMGGQQAEVYTVRIGERKEQAFYRSKLFPDAQASPLRCTQKAVMYNVLWIASRMANSVRLLLEGKPYNVGVIYDFENELQYNLVP